MELRPRCQSAVDCRASCAKMHHSVCVDRTTPTIAAATATAVTTTTPTYVLLGLEDTKPFNLAAQKLSLQLTEPPLEPPQPHGPQPLRRGF